MITGKIYKLRFLDETITMSDQPSINVSGAKALGELGKRYKRGTRQSASNLVAERLALETQTFTVTISREQFEKLKWLANSQSISATSALERAIETEYYIKEQIIVQGKKILVQSPNKSIQAVVFE